MKYSAVILAFAVGVFAVPQAASTTTALTPQASCLASCNASDVTCRAQCLGVARPNESQVADTNACAYKCDQGDGSPAATEKYGQCLQSCYASFFPSSQTLAPAAGASNAASHAASNAASATVTTGAQSIAASASGTGAKPSGTSSASGSASSASPTGAANVNSIQIAGAGIAGLVMAIFAL
ncbi:hypothetical protein BCR34DRAFT_638345 [Clohesyomyces aquaticus]|uniref:Uncharacterized protein n=1 Tax=Clohesyomyces aquaticus TaxID=1231657 RepID=A0A1Y1YQY0_9PLEO|nr:hypothetical protein BCR34DRAFT_638345 [Clohesyomyces aquaticus]